MYLHKTSNYSVYAARSAISHANLGTMDTQSNLTSFGLKTSKLQVGPMMRNMIVCSEKHGCGEEILNIAEMMSYETL